MIMIILSALLSGCGEVISNPSSSSDSSISSSENSIINETSTPLDTTDDFDYSSYDNIAPSEISEELKNTRRELINVSNSTTVNYLFLTDTHIDSQQSLNNETLVLKTLEYAVILANTSDIDFLCIGGDFITGAFDIVTAVDGLHKVSEALADCKKPVVMLIGNHDLNVNSNNLNNPGDRLSIEEVLVLTQENFKKDSYNYDASVSNGAYFYFDIPEKKTRAVCLDSYNSIHEKQQVLWLADKVLTVKDEGWKYVFLMHIPIDSRYVTTDTSVVCSGSEDIMALITALNNRSTATGSFGTRDFTDFKSKIVSCSFGHVHNSYMEYNNLLDTFCTATGPAGGVAFGNMVSVSPDDNFPSKRDYLTNENKDKYLFDVFSVSSDSITRIRFGGGLNKTCTAD